MNQHEHDFIPGQDDPTAMNDNDKCKWRELTELAQREQKRRHPHNDPLTKEEVLRNLVVDMDASTFRQALRIAYNTAVEHHDIETPTCARVVYSDPIRR